jgi:hypothetical protein
MEPGWYIGACDLVASHDGTFGLRGLWWLFDEEKGGAFEIESTLKRGGELFLPVMFQVTRSGSASVTFIPTEGLFWFRSISVQKLN